MAKRNRFDVDEKLETSFSFKHLKRVTVYIKKHWAKMLLALICSVVSVVSGLLYPLILQRAFDVTIPNKDMRELIILSVILLLSIALSIVMVCVRTRLMVITGQKIIYEIRRDLFEHLQKLPFQYYDDRPQGKILTRVIQYVNNISDALTGTLINLVLDVINLVFIGVFMFSVDVKLSLVVLAGLPFFGTIMFFLPRFMRKGWRNYSNKTSNLNAYTQESVDGIKITQLFGREEVNEKTYTDLSKVHAKSWKVLINYLNVGWTSVENLTCWVKGAIYLIGILAFGGTVSFGTIVAISDYAIRFWGPISNMSASFNQIINSVSYLERIFEVIDEPVVVGDTEDAVEIEIKSGEVTFDNVTFAYEEGTNILENISFKAAKGESIAFVGPTGAGKTTVVNLISRFYNVTDGRVLIDNTDISKVTLHSLRSQMGVMLQDSFIFSGTIADNIRYSKLDATDAEIKKVCKTLGIDAMIKKLGGYNAQINERGGGLSQGQKQLIAIARTMLSDPKIIILDEATSSIDAKTEKMVQNAIDELLKGRTSFVIAHRLSTIKNCDKIMVISDKGIKESGSHQELLEKKEAYYKLYTAQIA